MSNEGNNDRGKNDMAFKMIVIGDEAVGKSCLTRREVRDVFNPKYNTIVGFESLSFTTKN